MTIYLFCGKLVEGEKMISHSPRDTVRCLKGAIEITVRRRSQPPISTIQTEKCRFRSLRLNIPYSDGAVC